MNEELPYFNNKADYLKAGKVDLVDMGTKLWYSFYRGMIIPVEVTEIDDGVEPSPALIEKYNLRYHQEDDGTNKFPYSLWVSRYAEGPVRVVGSSAGDKDENGWPNFIEIKAEDLDEQCIWHNQMVWIDEPIGHEGQVGYDFYRTLDQAMNSTESSLPRVRNHANKKLISWRKMLMKFVDTTNGVVDYNSSFWPNYFKKDKRVYVKR